MKLSWRHIFPLADLAMVGPVSIGEARTPSTNLVLSGLNISLRYHGHGWEVMVPMQNQKWYPGYQLAIEWIPLTDFLSQIETEFQGEV